jgi:hypothetical protein
VVVVVGESSIIYTGNYIVGTVVHCVVVEDISSDRIVRDDSTVYIELAIRDLEEIVGIVVIYDWSRS